MSSLPLEIGAQIGDGRFTIEEVVGVGGMGVVYRARDEQEASIVAVKVAYGRVGPSTQKRLRREAKLLKSMSHPNVVEFKFSGVHDNTYPFVVMEYLQGETLGDRVARVGGLAATEIIPLFVKLAEALEYIHARGILHRDIKPENILLLESAHGVVIPKLVDFGLANGMGIVVSEGSLRKLTEPGSVFGSIGFMSPEQVLGEVLTPVTDVFSLAASLRFALVGQNMFHGATPIVQMQRVLHQEPESLVARLGQNPIFELLDQVLARALARKPEARINAHEFKRCLLDVACGREAADHATNASPSPRSEGKWFWGNASARKSIPLSPLSKREADRKPRPDQAAQRRQFSFASPKLWGLVVAFIIANLLIVLLVLRQ